MRLANCEVGEVQCRAYSLVRAGECDLVQAGIANWEAVLRDGFCGVILLRWVSGFRAIVGRVEVEVIDDCLGDVEVVAGWSVEAPDLVDLLGSQVLFGHLL